MYYEGKLHIQAFFVLAGSAKPKAPEITEITDNRLSTEERRFVHHVNLLSSQNDPRERHPLHLEMLSSDDDDDKIVSKILINVYNEHKNITAK